MEKKGIEVNTIRKRCYASKDEKHKRKAIRRPDSDANFLKSTSDQTKTGNFPPPCTRALGDYDHSSRELTDCEVFKTMTSLDERGAEALQALVTPETFEGIATQLEKAQRQKQQVRISQGKSSARLDQPELTSEARVDATELSRKAQKKYLNMVHVGIAFVQLYFFFTQTVCNSVFSYMFIDQVLGTQDPKSQEVRRWKSWQSD